MQDYNPYAAPETDVSYPALEGEVWREGNVLVMTKQARLPNRCIKCNAPTNLRLKRNLMWHPSFWYLLILFNIILYAIVAMVVRKTAKIEVPLCERHLRRRRRMIWTAWLLALGGIALIVIGASNSPTNEDVAGAFGVVGGLTILAGVIVGAIVSQLVVVKKIDQRLVWLKKVDEDFLAELPTFGVELKKVDEDFLADL